MSDQTSTHAPAACAKRSRHAAGFTLVEALMASVILAFSVTALLQAIGAGQAQTYHALHEARAAALNNALLDELLSEPTQLDQRDSDIRSSDDIIDAHGPAYRGFEQTITVEAWTMPMHGLGSVTGKRITIQLHHDRAGEWVVHRFVRNAYGMPGGGDGGTGDEMFDDDTSHGGGG